MANIDKFRDDEVMELTPAMMGVEETHDDEELVADGDYGHDHIPTDESEDNPDAMETAYEKAPTVEKTEKDPSDDAGSVPSEQEEEPEPEVAPEPDQKVPLSRLNKEISKRQALEERLQQLESNLQQQPAEIERQDVQIDPAAFAKMSEALLDGKSDDAMGVFAEMMKSVANTAAHNAVAESQQYANKVSQVNIAQSTQAELLQQTAHEMVETYSILNDQSPDFNGDALQTVIDMRDDFIASGRFHPHVALERAAKLVMMDHGVFPNQAPVAPVAAPLVKKVDVAAKVAKAAQQPARIGGDPSSGGGQPKLDIGTMTDDDFDKLSADQLRRLRGDFI